MKRRGLGRESPTSTLELPPCKVVHDLGSSAFQYSLTLLGSMRFLKDKELRALRVAMVNTQVAVTKGQVVFCIPIHLFFPRTL